MTREKAKLLVKNCDNGNEVIDKIYDEFESRICKNCKYYSSNELLRGICKNFQLKLKTLGLHFVPQSEDFGCNKFEKKAEEGQ